MTTTTTPNVPTPNAPTPEPEPLPCPALASGEQTSTTSDSHRSPQTLQPTPEKRALIRKEPMKDFVWGVSRTCFLVHCLVLTGHMAMKGDLIRKTLPILVLPRWLDPLWVDINDPTQLPLCWYGVPFVPKLIYAYAERVGLASYYTVEVLRCMPGDLDPFRTWGNLQDWFEKESGLKLDLNFVWGEDGEHDTVLTFWSNHELDNMTTKMWDLACDLLDHMDYGEEYEMMWYLDQGLRVRRLSSFSTCFLTITNSTRCLTVPDGLRESR